MSYNKFPRSSCSDLFIKSSSQDSFKNLSRHYSTKSISQFSIDSAKFGFYTKKYNSNYFLIPHRKTYLILPGRTFFTFMIKLNHDKWYQNEYCVNVNPTLDEKIPEDFQEFFKKKKSCYMLSKFSAFWLKVQKSIRRSWKESSSAEVYHIFREFISFFSFRKKKTPKPDPGPSLYFRILDVSLEKLLEVFVNKHFEDFFGKCLQESVEEFLGGITCRIPGYMF